MGKVQYTGSIRAKDPLQCCHGALGRNLVMDYTLQRKPFHSPADEQLWRHRSPVWLGVDDQSSISYTQQAASQKVYMREAGVSVKKVTHVWLRQARDMDDQGCEDDVSDPAAVWHGHAGQQCRVWQHVVSVERQQSGCSIALMLAPIAVAALLLLSCADDREAWQVAAHSPQHQLPEVLQAQGAAGGRAVGQGQA